MADTDTREASPTRWSDHLRRLGRRYLRDRRYFLHRRWHRLTHLRADLRYYGLGLFHGIGRREVFLCAQAIAFKVLLAVVPILVLAIGLFGRVLRDEEPFGAMGEFIRTLLPPGRSERFIDFLGQVVDASGTLTLIGSVGLLISITTLFTSLRITIRKIFGEAGWAGRRKPWWGYLFDLRMAVQVGVCLVATIGLTVLLRSADHLSQPLFGALFPGLPWSGEELADMSRLGMLVPFLFTLLVFMQLYYFVPRPHPPWRSVCIGALLSAVLWDLAKQGFAFYVGNLGHVERYLTDETDLGPLADTFGLVLLFVSWAYLSGLILGVGALVVDLHARRHHRASAD